MQNFREILLGLGLVAFICSGLLYLIAWGYQSEYAYFKAHGIEREATVTEKYERKSGRSNSYHLKVRYFDKSILEGGEFYMESTEVNYQVWKKHHEDDKVIIYMDPKAADHICLKASTNPENFVPFEKYSSAWFVLGLGLFLLISYGVLGMVFPPPTPAK